MTTSDGNMSNEITNLQSKITFLQMNHGETLRNLHSEISSLQKKNQDLSYQLTIVTDSELNDEKLARTEQLETELKHQKEKLKKRDAECVVIAGRLKESESNFQRMEQSKDKTLSEQEAMIMKLQCELDRQSSTIALLSNQLHKKNKAVMTPAANAVKEDALFSGGDHPLNRKSPGVTTRLQPLGSIHLPRPPNTPPPQKTSKLRKTESPRPESPKMPAILPPLRTSTSMSKTHRSNNLLATSQFVFPKQHPPSQPTQQNE